MSMPTFLETNDMHGRSAGVAVGELVFADASAIDLDTLARVAEAETVADETRICLDRLQQTLALAGSGLPDVIKVNAYLAEDEYREEFWAAYDAHFPDGPKPPRVTQVTSLDGDARVLIDAVAVRARARPHQSTSGG
jgi:2-iminobutanoate/2-iminopropanoate deaminase